MVNSQRWHKRKVHTASPRVLGPLKGYTDTKSGSSLREKADLPGTISVGSGMMRTTSETGCLRERFPTHPFGTSRRFWYSDTGGNQLGGRWLAGLVVQRRLRTAKLMIGLAKLDIPLVAALGLPRLRPGVDTAPAMNFSNERHGGKGRRYQSHACGRRFHSAIQSQKPCLDLCFGQLKLRNNTTLFYSAVIDRPNYERCCD